MFRSQLRRMAAVSLYARASRQRIAVPRAWTVLAVAARHNSSSTTVTTDGVTIPKSVLELSVSDYHTYADETLENMIMDLEELMDTQETGNLDAELSLTIPNSGDYVINKQPPNKQIWVSSPISGPNRFDYIDGEWVSLRDGAKLLDVIALELSEGLGQDFKFSEH